MAILHTTFCRLSLSNVFLPYKYCCNRLSTSTPLPKLSVEEKLGIKPRPKRPRSSFLRFLSQIKPQILEQNPKATVTEINRIAGEKWRHTDEKVKSKLMEEYKTDWNKYLDDINTYNKKLSPVQQEQIQKAHQILSQNKKKNKLKKKMEEMGKPKKPASTFVAYMQSKIHERGETPFKEWQQVVKKEWESAPASVKEIFQNNFQKGMESYKTELEVWEKKMKREGHQDLVRRSQS